MKKLFIVTVIIVVVNLQQLAHAQTKAAAFKSYVESLQSIPLPFSLYSWNNTTLNLSPRYSLQGFKRFKSVAATKAGAIISKNNNYVVLMDFNVSDGGMNPFLTSYTPDGNKIDSFVPFTKTSADQGFFASERLTIDRDKKIIILDTIKTWRDNSAGKTIPGTKKIKTGKSILVLNPKGKFTRLAK